MSPAVPALADFFDHVLDANPFAVNRVVPSAAVAEDAGPVHRRQSLQLLDLAGQACEQRPGVGALLWGEAGIGKSHLLARLATWALPNHRRAVVLMLANLQAEPGQLPRSLLRCVISILTRGKADDFYDTPLFRLANAGVREALRGVGGAADTWPVAEAAYHRLVDQLCAATPSQPATVDRRAYTVLFRFFESAYLAHTDTDDGVAALAVRWLGGDYLDPAEARALGLTPPPNGETVGLADDEQVKAVLIALCQLAVFWRKPVVVCLDQVDNLEPAQFAALARFLHALLDGAANLLVLTAGVRETLARWEAEGVVPKSTWDRLAHDVIELQRVSVAEGRQIVQSRLQTFRQPFLALTPVAELVRKDELFPLGESWAAEFLGHKIEVRPRDVINWAREGWRRQQAALRGLGGDAWLEGWAGRKLAGEPVSLAAADLDRLVDEQVARKLLDLKQQRLLDPASLPQDPDHLSGLLHALLQRSLLEPGPMSLLGVERLPRPKNGARPAYDMLLRRRHGADGEAFWGLLCLVVENRNSMTAHLRRLAQDTRPLAGLFLISDERVPLDPGAGGCQYLDQLRQRFGERYHHVNLTFDQYADLDALQGVVGLARSGDLEVETPGGSVRRLSEADVLTSFRRQQCYLARPVLRLLLTGEDRAAIVRASAV